MIGKGRVKWSKLSYCRWGRKPSCRRDRMGSKPILHRPAVLADPAHVILSPDGKSAGMYLLC